MTTSRLLRVLGHSATAAAVLVIALLVRQHRDLSLRHRELRMRMVTLARGDAVPVFRAGTSAGDSITVGEPKTGERQVIVVLTKECPFCRATLPAWREIAESLASATTPRAGMVAVALDSLREMSDYLASYGLRVPIVTFPDRRTRKLFRAGFVPQTVVINDSGIVLYARTGVISDRAVRDSVISAALSQPNRSVAAAPR